MRARGFLLGNLALLALTAASYAPVLRAGFIWDDNDYITDNRALQSVDGLGRIWLQPGAVSQYYPLTYSSFWVEYRLWGLNASGYHVVNVLLHGLNACLLWRLLLRLRLGGAWLAAAIFALHPVHVESVAWVTERKNVLSGLFFLLAIHAWLRFDRREADAAAKPTWRKAWYGLALLAFLAALLSKTAVVFLPVVLALLVWWRRGRLDRRDLLALVPFVAGAAVLSCLTMYVERQFLPPAEEMASWTPAQRVLLASRALWFYAGKLVFPVGLAHVYPHWTPDPTVWWQWAYPTCAAVILLVAWLARRRIGRGPLVGGLYFVAGLLPVLGFVDFSYLQAYAPVADHFQYHAGIGLIALGAALLSTGLGRGLPRLRRFAPAGAGVLLAVLAMGTWQRAHVFRDGPALWRDTLAKNPACGVGHTELGTHLAEQGELEEAVRHLETAMRLRPTDAVTALNLANAYRQMGRLAEALRMYRAALELNDADEYVHYNLGILYARLGNRESASRHFQRAVELRPDFPEAAHNLRVLLALPPPPPATQP